MTQKQLWALLSTMIVITVLLSVVGWQEGGITTEPVSAGSDTAAASEPTAPFLCRLGVWKEQLAVFRGAAQTPDEVYDVWIGSLPADEQQRLQEGIWCDESTCRRLLEDYTS